MRTSIAALSTLLVSLLLFAAAAPSAGANATDDRIINDCENSLTSALTGSYTKAELRHALNNLPGDSYGYSGCYDAIRQALREGGRRSGDGTADGLGGTSGSGGSGTGGLAAGGGAGANAGFAPGTPQHVGTKAPVEVAGTVLQPGTLPSIGRNANELPDAVIVLLGLLGGAMLAVLATTIGRRVVARRRA